MRNPVPKVWTDNAFRVLVSEGTALKIEEHAKMFTVGTSFKKNLVAYYTCDNEVASKIALKQLKAVSPELANILQNKINSVFHGV